MQNIDPKTPNFALNEPGCGCGVLIGYLRDEHAACSYFGVDVSCELIKVAVQRYANSERARFIGSAEPDEVIDDGLASGIFNVCLGRSDTE